MGQNNDNNREALTRLGVDPSTVVVEITVDEAILATYVGEYSAQGAVLTVSMGDDGLELSVPGQSSPMIPRSDTEFIAFEGIVTVTFEVDDTGAVTGMKGSQGGQEMHFERVESGGGG